MSLGIHVGQCGNQVGAAYWRLAGAATSRAADREDGGSTTRTGARNPPATSSDHGRVHLFHPRSGHARCILVDAEPKAVRAAVRACGPAFHPSHVLTEHRGRGNNWAMGYYFTERGTIADGKRTPARNPAPDNSEHLADRVLDALRREVEALDAYRGSLVTLSLGGGTGAGVGSRVLERVRDAYPRAFLVAAAVAPSVSAGGSPLQNYNAVLALQTLREHADAVVYRDNDELLRTTRYWRALVARGSPASASASMSASASSTPPRPGSSAGVAASGDVRVTLAEMNDVLAADLAGLTLPTTAGASDPALASWRPFDAGKLVHDVCPMPDARFVDVRSGVMIQSGLQRADRTRSAADRLVFHALAASANLSVGGDVATLDAVARATAQAFPRANYGSIASTALVRGFAASASNREVVARWLDAAVPRLAWPASAAAATFSPASPFLSASGKSQRPSASVTMCANNGHFIPTTRVFLDRARRQFSARAYLHWYEQHGLPLGGEHDAFREAFDACDALVSNYEALLAAN